MLTTIMGRLRKRESRSRITLGIYPNVDRYVEMEMAEAVDPAKKAGIKLLKKISQIETRIKHAII